MVKKIVLMICMVVLAGKSVAAESQLAVETITIVTQQGQVSIEAELAKTPQEQAKGLMFRPHMPENHGMLFDFGQPKHIMMWMKNTVMPLDMVFMDKTGRVIGVIKNTQPLSLDTLSVEGDDTKAVLELNAGASDTYHITRGDKVNSTIFK